VSPGCEHCYAESFAKRTGHAVWGTTAPRRFFGEAHWAEPLKWNAAAERAATRARVFCASMADAFEWYKPLDSAAALGAARAKLWALIAATPHLDWQLLTKRPGNVMYMVPPEWRHRWPCNVWIGTTAEDEKRLEERLPALLGIPAPVRFLSCEPLLADLGPLRPCFEPFPAAAATAHHLETNHDCSGHGEEAHCHECGLEWRADRGVDWVIVGGESGPGARPCALGWIRSIVRDCRNAGVPVFVKQLGAAASDEVNGIAGRSLVVPDVAAGLISRRLRDRKGGDPAEWPEDLRIRELPRASLDLTDSERRIAALVTP
jgi:protein gp37